MVHKIWRNIIYALEYGWHWTDFHEANARPRLFVKNFYIDFHENLTNGLFADARSHTDGLTDGRGLPIKRSLFHHKEQLQMTDTEY